MVLCRTVFAMLNYVKSLFFFRLCYEELEVAGKNVSCPVMISYWLTVHPVHAPPVRSLVSRASNVSQVAGGGGGVSCKTTP
jgi:hypothetical protein